ncbi:MAG: SDR family oxidoreductase [Actinobacteria bacterium]|nr:SDR family oxidoreductase [Actinomycetota bacterium]
MAGPAAPPSRSVLVAGAARGIGLATARRLAADGHRVTATWHVSEPADDAGGAEDRSITWRRCDVTDPASVQAVVDEARADGHPFDVVVANAALVRDRMVSRMTEADFRAVIDVNLRGSFHLARAALSDMARARWGRVVFVGSVGGSYGLGGQASYSASKAGLLGLARSLAREVGPRGVTVNVVAPGPIDTELIAGMSTSLRERWKGLTPAERMGRPAEVAGAIAFLASEPAGAITGAVIPVDGGFLA